MTAVETTVHVGPDGILRLEVPVNERNRDLTVIVMVSDAAPTPEPASAPQTDPWGAYRQRLEAAGLEVRPASAWSARQMSPLRLQGPPVSQTVVEDRR